MSSLENLNNHIDLCTRRLELEDQALLATAAGDYDQADQCDREIEQLTGQIEELNKKLDEEAQGEIRKLKDKLQEKTNTIEQAVIELEKAATVLDHWMNEYLYNEKPDPQAAISQGRGKARGGHYDQSAQWYFEYGFITQFICIASDYVYNSKEALERAI